MYPLEYKPEKVHASDDKSLKMNHATFALDSATTTPSSGKKNKMVGFSTTLFCDAKSFAQHTEKYKFHINQCPSYPHQEKSLNYSEVYNNYETKCSC